MILKTLIDIFNLNNCKFSKYLALTLLVLQLSFLFWRFLLKDLLEISLVIYLINYIIIIFSIKSFLLLYKVYKSKFSKSSKSKLKVFLEGLLEEIEILKRKFLPLTLEYYIYRNLNFFSNNFVLLTIFVFPFLIYILFLVKEIQSGILKYSVILLAFNSIYQRAFISLLNWLFYSNLFKLYSFFDEGRVTKDFFNKSFYIKVCILYKSLDSLNFFNNTFYAISEDKQKIALDILRKCYFFYTVYFFNLLNLKVLLKKYTILKIFIFLRVFFLCLSKLSTKYHGNLLV